MHGQKSIQMLIYTCGQTELTDLNKLDIWGVDNYFFWEVLRRKMACLQVWLKSGCDKLHGCCFMLYKILCATFPLLLCYGFDKWGLGVN